MKIFFDTEFTGLHKDTTLISLGCVDENGRSFYAEFTDYDNKQVNDWIKENVIPYMMYRKAINNATYIDMNDPNYTGVNGSKAYVTQAFKKWLSEYDDVQFVSDVCHYDMVLLIDLFGTAFDLPEGVSAVCHDLNQDIASYFGWTDTKAFDESREGMLDKPIEGSKHNSLYDARVIKALYDKFHRKYSY